MGNFEREESRRICTHFPSIFTSGRNVLDSLFKITLMVSPTSGTSMFSSPVSLRSQITHMMIYSMSFKLRKTQV